MSDDYKLLHESFVSNHTGSTSWEVCAATLPAFLSTFIIQVLLPWTPLSGFNRSTVFSDFAIAVIPQIAVLTIANHYIEHIITLQILTLSLAICFRYWVGYLRGGKAGKRGGTRETKPWKQLTFITHFRATLLLVTVISILAVDFPVFPRRFAKTEISGFGLMDIGVGMFVVSNGIVAAHARQTKLHRLRTIWGEFKGSLLMMTAAAVRLLSTRSVDYHQHDSEYGVHWNFFCTLALVKIGSACVLAVIPRRFSLTMSLICATAYQYALEYSGVRDYLLSDKPEDIVDHTDFVYLNRGGLLSCFGYLAIYFASVHIGTHLFKPRRNLKEWLRFDIQLGFVSAILWIALLLCHHYVDPVSRRTANLTYVIWVMMHGTQHLALFLAADIAASYLTALKSLKRKGAGKLSALTLQPCSSVLLQAINKNGFFYFVLANLLTGVVNISMKTIFTGPFLAVAVIFIYTIVLNATVVTCLIKDRVILRL